MQDPTGPDARLLISLAPLVLGETTGNGLPPAAGGFHLSAFYNGESAKLIRRQFTGPAPLRLHDPVDGEAVVAIGDIGALSLAYVRSTGHDVVVPEIGRPNLLVPVTGRVSSRNRHMRFEQKRVPWVLFGRGKRETTVLAEKDAPYQAFVLSMPSDELGAHLHRLESHGGMIWGDALRDDDMHLAKLILALATQVSFSADRDLDMRLAEAWKTIVVAQLNRCLEKRIPPRGVPSNRLPRDLPSRYVDAAAQLMRERTDEIKTIRDIARHVGVSERTLQAAFRTVRGSTPMQVLSQTRLHHARQALLDPDGPDTISEVCAMCGIEHHGRFSAHYKKAFGELPSTTLMSRRKA